MKKLVAVLYALVGFSAVQAVEQRAVTVAPGTGIVGSAAQKPVIASRLGSPKKSAPVVQIEEVKSLVYKKGEEQFCVANLLPGKNVTVLTFLNQAEFDNILAAESITAKIVTIAGEVADQYVREAKDFAPALIDLAKQIVTWSLFSTLSRPVTADAFYISCIDKSTIVKRLEELKKMNPKYYTDMGYKEDPNEIDNVYAVFVTTDSYHNLLQGIGGKIRETLKIYSMGSIRLSDVAVLEVNPANTKRAFVMPRSPEQAQKEIDEIKEKFKPVPSEVDIGDVGAEI